MTAGAAGRTWTQRLGPLGERNFAWFFASRFTNFLGRTMATVALAFAVLDLTGSATALGQVLAAHTIPMVVFLLFGGVISDRLPRTLVVQFSNVVSAATQGMVATLLITGTAELWMLVVLEAVSGLAGALSFPAMSSMVPQLVPREELQQANALLSMSRGVLTIIGPTTGALLVVTVGSGWALAVDALAWLLAALLLVPVRLPARAPREEGSTAWRELREGWDLFRGTTWLWVVVLAFGLLNMIHHGAWYTLGPALAQETIGRQAWGYVLSAESVGLLLMTVVMLWVPMGRPLLLGMVGCAVMGLPILLLGVEPRLALLLVAALLAGAGIEVFSMGWNLAMQENIPDEQLSRAYSYDALGSFAAMPLGQLAYGPLGELFGYAEVLTVSGVLYVLISLATLASRSVRDLPRRPTAPPT
jgi:MFS family permease